MNDIRFPDYQIPGAVQQSFNPYESNGGTVAAIAGDDFVVIASDTRLSSGYSIHARDQNKIFKLTSNTVLASSGCWPDSLAYLNALTLRLKHYDNVHNKTMSTEAIAQLTSILMYNRRFFPYYVSNMVAGIDSEGKGAVYSYDPIGHCERATHRATGSSGHLLQPLLDNQVDFKNQSSIVVRPKMTITRAVDILHDIFVSAAERDIHTGDFVEIYVIDGKEESNRVMLRHKNALRQD
jgi:20S proteasome subunit beta 6